MPLNPYDEALEALEDQDQAPANPYLETLDQIDTTRTQQLRTATIGAQATTPDRAAKVLSIARQTGLAADVVERNFEDLAKRVTVEDVASSDLLEQAPKLADWLSTPQHAAVAADDHGSLSLFERALRYGGWAIPAGMMGFSAGGWRAIQSAAELAQSAKETVVDFQRRGLGLDAPDAAPSEFAAFAKRQAEVAQAVADRLRGPRRGAGFVEQAVYRGLESVGQSLPSIAIGLAAGARAMLTSVGVTAGGQTYGEARSQGLWVGASLGVASIQGAVEVATEFIPAKRLLGDVAKNAPLLATLGRQLASEIPGEQIATVLQDLNEWAFLPANKDRTFRDYLAERPSAAAATLISTIVATGLQTTGTHATVRMMERLGETAQASKTLERSPEAFDDFLAQATKDTPTETLYAPIDTFQQYWQSQGVDPAQAAVDLTGSRAAYDEAVALGTDLAIPTARYVTTLAATDHHAFFINELRTQPDEMNGRELEALEEQAKAQEQAAQEQAALAETAALPPREQVRQLVIEELTQGGKIPQETAEQYATMLEAAFGTQAERAGLDPVELYRQYGLTIQRSDLAPAAPSSQLSAISPQESPTTGSAPLGNVAATQAAEGGVPVPAVAQPDLAPAIVEATDAAYADYSAQFDAETAPAVDTRPEGAQTQQTNASATPLGEQLPGDDPQSLAAAPVRQDVAGGTPDRVTESASRRVPPSARDQFPRLHADARARGFTGSDDSLVDQFLDKYERAREIAESLEQDVADTGWRSLLVEISKMGGLGLDAEAGGHEGEVSWLLESLAAGSGLIRKGRRAGQFMPRRSAGLKGAPGVIKGKGQGGLSLDHVRENLAQDPRWAHLDNLNDLLELLEEAVGKGHIENQGGDPDAGASAPNVWSTLEGLLDVREGSDWWTNPEEGDDSFDPREFFQRLFGLPFEPTADTDTLDTGEQQPRLPGDVGEVREEETATPEFEAPFSLTSEVSKAKKGKQTELFQPLFHGSPHDFDRFSTAHIGRGEGAQAYGWGLYFAENPAVAADYHDRLSGGRDVVKMRLGTLAFGVPNFDYSRRAHVNTKENIRAALAEDLLADALELNAAGEVGFQAHVLAMLDQRIADYEREYPAGVAPARQLRTELAKPGAVNVKFTKTAGGVYQVEIPDEQVAKMLDWDAPLSAQPPSVQVAVQRLQLFEDTAAGIYGRYSHVRRENPTGDAIYQEVIAKVEAGSGLAGQEGASRALFAAGVSGLRYFDQGSRLPGGGAYRVRWSDDQTTANVVDAQGAVVQNFQTFNEADAWVAAHAPVGTRNVVVFDESIVTLTHKDGSPVTAQERNEFFQSMRGESDKRGSLKFGADRQMTLSLFERADLSTIIHESAHLFLEVMQDLANRPDANDQIRADLATLQDWAVDDDHVGSGFSERQHEQIARGFEAYVMEGRAPSVELRGAFSRMRAWMLGIYRTLRGLNVRLNDDVRAVFDRLLATDAAIADAQAAGQVVPMFTTPEAAGMTPEEFSLYRATVADASRTARERLDRQLLAEVQREQTAQWKAQREAVEAAVTAEVHAQPVYRVLAAMQHGTHPDGTILEEGLEPLKLSKAILVDRYGAERLRTLPKPYVYRVDGGLDPDTVAELFGFTSGDEMLTACAEAPPMRAVIQRETSRRMLAEHGSLLLDGSLHERAQAALSNEDQETVVRAELAALGKLRRTVAPFEQAARAKTRAGVARIRATLPSSDALREMARVRIATTRIRDIRPQVFWHASRRAAAQALDAAARQDFDAAIATKQQELYNLALYREATRARDDVDARVRRAKALGKPAARARLGLAGESYLDQIDGILDRYEFATVSRKALDRRASLRKWVAALEGDGLPVDLPEELLEETRRTNYLELTVEELIGVTDGLAQIVHLARLKNRLLKAAEKRELDEVAGTLAESIRDHARRTRRRVSRDRRPSEERTRTIGDFFGGHRKLASLLREMDGFADGGPAWDAIMRPLNEAGAREAEMTADATRAFAAVVERAFPGREKRQLYTKRFIPAIGDSLSRMECLMVALNWGNEGNRDRIRRAENWNDGQVRAVLDTLTATDLQFVQGVFDLIDGYWPAIEAKQKRVYGVAPEKVVAVPVVAAGGEIPGGYFPLKYDDRLSARAIAALDLDAANLAKQAAYAQATTKRGHTKERAATVKLPVRMDFGVMFEHVAQVVHDLSHHETLIDVGRILGHAEVQQAILDTQGDQVYKQIRNTVRDVAFGDVPATNGFERAMNHVRMGSTVAGLGWNLTTALLQPIGLSNSMVRIGPTWVARGVGRWIRNPTTMVETVRWIEASSDFMRSRGRTQQREISEIRNQIRVSTGTMGGWVDDVLSTTTRDRVTRQGIADSYFWMIQQMQRVADVPTWLGQYEKSLAAGESETRAIALADQAVLDSQGGGQTKDLAHVQRGGPMLRLWTNFYSYFNVVYNQATESTKRTRFTHPAEVGRLAADYLLLFVVPATLGVLLKEALRPSGDDADELAKKLALENLGYLMGTMLGLREVSGAVAGAYGYEGPAGARGFAAFGKLVKQAGQGETDAAFWKALNDAAGILLHYPASQAAKTAGGVAALAEGRTENPAAVVAGPPRKAQP